MCDTLQVEDVDIAGIHLLQRRQSIKLAQNIRNDAVSFTLNFNQWAAGFSNFALLTK